VSTLKLTIAYDGTRYVGWQRQAAGDSVQGLIEEAVARLAGGPVSLHGAGRTDAGVHALGQVASVTVDVSHTPETWTRALNATLPADIRVLRTDVAADDFHARFSATGKTYWYRLICAPVVSPFDLRYAWHVTYALDVDAMRAALARFVGRHDFAAFQGARTDIRDTIRTIETVAIVDTPLHGLTDLAWPTLARPATASASAAAPDRSPLAAASGRVLTFAISGNGFLRHMVRSVVGTCVDVGRGRWPPEAMTDLLAGRDRRLVGPTAPACGLFLVEVRY